MKEPPPSIEIDPKYLKAVAASGQKVETSNVEKDYREYLQRLANPAYVEQLRKLQEAGKRGKAIALTSQQSRDLQRLFEAKQKLDRAPMNQVFESTATEIEAAAQVFGE